MTQEKQKNNIRKDILTIMGNYTVNKKNTYIVIFFMVISSILILYQPIITSYIYQSIENKNFDDIYFYAILGIGILAISIITDLIRKFYLGGLEYEINHNNYKKYIHKLTQKDLNLIFSSGSGKLLNIFSQGIEAEGNIFKEAIWLIGLVIIRGFTCIYIVSYKYIYTPYINSFNIYHEFDTQAIFQITGHSKWQNK